MGVFGPSEYDVDRWDKQDTELKDSGKKKKFKMWYDNKQYEVSVPTETQEGMHLPIVKEIYNEETN